MNDSDISDLARMLPVPDARDFQAGRQLTLKEHLMTEVRIARDHQAAPSPVRRARLRPRIVAGLTAGAALAGAAVAVIALVPGHSGNSGSISSGTPTAASLLAKIAAAEASQPTPVVKNSDFMYIESESASFLLISGKHPTMGMGPMEHRQIWLSVSNICTVGILDVNGVSGPISALPMKDGKTLPAKDMPGLVCGIGNLNDPTYRFAQTLPTNPRALLDYITGSSKANDQSAFATLGNLISEVVMPPKVWAAVYRAAALIPGVTVVDNVPNALGQRGIAIQESSGQATFQWIFNKQTLQYIGSRSYNTATGKTMSQSAIISSGIVARPGDLP